jgi:hypothetical protein
MKILDFVQWSRLDHSQGPDWVGSPCPTPEDGDKASLQNVVYL